MEHLYQLAIIGAGPAGIATAIESYALGMRDIVLLEKDENHNATIRKFYKDNKRVDVDWKGQKIELDGTIYFVDGTKETTLDFFDQLLDNEVMELRTHTEVQKIVKTDEGFEVFIAGSSLRAKYVVVTIGRMGKPNKPDYKIPPSIKNQVHYTLDACGSGEKIMVVGGGDSAIEYAVELCDRNEVAICYRRGTFRRANPTNQADIDRVVSDGLVRAMLNTEIVELESEGGQVKVIFGDGESELFDRLVYAIGGTTPSGFLQSSGIREEDGKPVHNEDYETNVEGLFVAGDITQESGGSIALGLNHGFAIANHIMNK
ncbi:MAG: NAD(P)-binding domain-containing protein [Sulfuricurvum sp.]|uniref:NAD(P)-binding domain-containing protein n=1 Tax=Sulfuricurvum sp. TaxID=2025608 RepID=UPI00262E88EE|nr:NAD(P)-binding domain-containing protein [Sulfuricurvum sp.]MDD2828676.1 NAD(P)-binding domain-containing protein [Sulfuricurvum sp.]MDD4949254.1 NAD(P)-binding domain-containing protein [Sulfuricurvum sp.]